VKYCTKCRIEKEPAAFYDNPNTKDKLTSWCKLCTQGKPSGTAKVTIYPSMVAERDHINVLWLGHLMSGWNCPKCRGTDNLVLYHDGQEVDAAWAISLSLHDLKHLATSCEFWCKDCVEKWSTLTRRVRESRRQHMLTSIVEADVRLSIRQRSTILNESAEVAGLGVIITTKEELYAQVRTNASCGICGESRAETLDFYHVVPGSKLGTISSMAHDKTDLRLFIREIEKCAVVCSNCHRSIQAKTVTTENLLPIRLEWGEK
jgi:hypothetical protein